MWVALHLRPPDGTYAALTEAYQAPGRHYHTLDHIEASLRRFDAVETTAGQPAVARVAIWFHDAVYDPRRQDNEALSADWATAVLEDAGAVVEVRRSVEEMILATNHLGPDPVDDAALVCDVDLAILGASGRRFDAYQRAIHAEYAWVPLDRYRQGRLDVLSRFLAREWIFQTESFRGRYEQRARRNLSRAIAHLSQSGPEN
jgi:predicted metal-dependent HD superfamily phosphohydrolase